jgi:phage FluMu gp28-like protein
MIQLPPLYEYQHRALFGPERYAVIEGATKVGKTFPALIWQLAEAGEVAARVGSPDARNHFWVAPTTAQAAMAYNRMCRMLRSAGMGDGEVRTNDTERRINITGLGVLWYKTGEEPDNLYGEDCWSAIMDEYTRQREEAWHAIRSTLTATGGRVRFIGNKRGKGWGWKLAREAERKQTNGDPDWTAHRISALDAVQAGLMSQKELDDAKAAMPQAVFEELYLCQDAEDASNPFGLGAIRACVKPLSTLPPVVFGIDLARSEDYTVVIGLDQNKDVCRFERWNGTTWDQTENRILSLIGNVPTLIDSTGVGDPVVERISRERPSVEGFKFTGGPSGTKQKIMEGLAVDIQSKRIGFPDGLIVSELEAYQYEYTRSGMTYDTLADHDDTVCALALANHKAVAQLNAPKFFVRLGGIR